jgi:organic radical activating enzyme
MQEATINSVPLPVMESFYTIQGEGFHQGKAAYFIRLGGCDVGCIWCDVKESWDASAHPLRTAEELLAEVKSSAAQLVVITGGEPLMHQLDHLTTRFRNAGLSMHLETSGSHPLSGTWDWICLSPKKFRAPIPELTGKADELKVIVYNQSDFAWAENFSAKVRDSCKRYLQPEWSRSAQITPQVISYIKAHPKWELSLQIHKFINVP